MNLNESAFPVSDIDIAREFYGGIWGCQEGRSAETWVDFNLYGHQIVAHYQPSSSSPPSTQDKALLYRNAVDGKSVPVPHFGVLIPSLDETEAIGVGLSLLLLNEILGREVL